MNSKIWIAIVLFTSVLFSAEVVGTKTLKVDRGLTVEGAKCVECHSRETPGHVNDWKDSRHGHVGVSCIDCHSVNADSPMAAQNCPGVKGTETFVTPLVSSNKCSQCHPAEADQFAHSGHVRGRTQIEGKAGMMALMDKVEGRNHPQFQKSVDITGCGQCHGTKIKLDANRRPTADTWPNFGIASLYPDGGVGNCAACHSKHKFSIAESRKPDACTSCHLGPDHPDMEVYYSSRHGQIYKTEGDTWKWDSAGGAWEPGDYRAPTCATCHMSGIGNLPVTHNVSERLHWNMWAPISTVRNSQDPLAPGYGDGVKGREMMKEVCKNCHGGTHIDNFFASGDKHVNLYNTYAKDAKKMFTELKEKRLIKKDKWKDAAFKAWYHLWHHEGRRMRHGALMGAPDYAHWHGSFEVMLDFKELEEIYKHRIETGKIE
jgi:hypothetical protein